MTSTSFFMPSEIYDYMLKSSLREDAVLSELRAVTSLMSTSNMQIAPEEGQLFSFLVKLIGATKTIDVGVFTGYSSLVVAMALPDNGKVIGCDINAEWTHIAQKYWQKGGQAHKIELRLAAAADTLNSLLESGHANSFDFIFIDADKKNYSTYYELSLQLLSPKGIIAIDNVLQHGRVADPDVTDATTTAIREFNDKLLQDERVDLTMIPIADGLTLVRKR